jgi:hypothetical protein
MVPWLPPSLQSVLALLDAGLDVRPSAIVEERMRELVESWRAEIRRPLEKGYQPQFLDAQSFTQLIILTVEATVRERLSEKRRMYGRLLARADTPAWGDEKIGRVEEALDALVRVSEGDLRVLKLITAHVAHVMDRGLTNEEQYYDAATISVEDLLGELTDLSRLGVKTYVTRLERLGLLLTRVLDSDQTAGSYIPTHLLEELIDLTRLPDSSRQVRQRAK